MIVFATMDPRGNKIGGIETHIRQILRNHPADTDLILAGIDELGDLEPGVAIPLTFTGRHITFIPLAHVPAEEAGVSASRLGRSTTLRFVLGGFRHLLALSRLIAGRAVSADMPRVEFAPLAMALRIPFVLTIHSDLAKASKTDSLLKRYGAIKRWSESIAFRAARHVFVVNAEIRAGLLAQHSFLNGKCDVMTVPVDTKLFSSSPFPASDVFRVVYAGRFDEVKDPRLMFTTIGHLAERMGNTLEFHIIGTADPSIFVEFNAIRAISILHGPQNAEGVARIISTAHCGIMTSHSEGMPCFLLETLASGRAFASVRLPSFEPLVLAHETGELVDRSDDVETTAAQLTAALTQIWAEIQSGAFSPEAIATRVTPYSVSSVFARLFDVHRRIRDGRNACQPSKQEGGKPDPAPISPR